MRELRAGGVTAPLLFMGYYNPILQYGLERFVAACAEVGVDGLIIPDLPPEEAVELHTACRSHQLDLIFMLAPTSTDDRIAHVATLASGFIYCVSLTGTTGSRAIVTADLPKFLDRIRAVTKLPLGVGFGITQPAQAQAVAAVADGVIVGAALINVVEHSAERGVDEAAAFTQSLRDAMDQR